MLGDLPVICPYKELQSGRVTIRGETSIRLRLHLTICLISLSHTAPTDPESRSTCKSALQLLQLGVTDSLKSVSTIINKDKKHGSTVFLHH